MKYGNSVFLFSLGISILFISSCSETEKTEDDLAREVFQCYVDNDAHRFKQLYVRQTDMQQLINKADMPNDIKVNARKRMRLRTAVYRTVSKAGFNYSRMEAYEDGVNWNDTEIVSINSEPSGYGFFDFDFDSAVKYGIEVKDIRIRFVSQKDTFEMRLDDCVKTKTRGWCMSEDLHIRKVGKYGKVYR